MKLLKQRTTVCFGAGVIAIVLGLGSAAYACTSYKGWLQVCDSSDGAEGVYCITSNGSGSGMNQSFSSGTGPTLTRGTESFTVEVGPITTTNKLPQRDSSTGNSYHVTFWNKTSKAYDRPILNYGTSGSHWLQDCMYSSLDITLGNIKSLGTLDVDANGDSIAKSFTLPSTAPLSPSGGQGAVCVSDPSAVNGNQAPIIIV